MKTTLIEAVRDRSIPIPAKGHSLSRLLLTGMRPHQWAKNLFVLAPLLFGKKLDDPQALALALLACAAFCLMSSSLYLLNDIFDAAADCAHPEKRGRPIASGELPVRIALAGAAALLGVSLGLARALGSPFLWLGVAYFVLTLGYSLVFKRAIVLDGMVIATGFVLRVVGGALAVHVVASHWLIICAFLLALYLAFAKRRQELLLLSGSANRHREVLGQYSVAYLDQVNGILLAAVIVCYALYTVAPETTARFGTDRLIYGTVFVLYGLLRYMALIQKPANGGNPSRMLVADKPLLASVLAWAAYNAAVIYQSSLAALWNRWP